MSHVHPRLKLDREWCLGFTLNGGGDETGDNFHKFMTGLTTRVKIPLPLHPVVEPV